MTEVERMKYLRIVFVVVGLIFPLGIWPLTMVWPSAWAWHAEGRSEYLEIILGIYATLVVFLLGYALESLSNSQFVLQKRVERKVIIETLAQEARSKGLGVRGKEQASRNTNRAPDSRKQTRC